MLVQLKLAYSGRHLASRALAASWLDHHEMVLPSMEQTDSSLTTLLESSNVLSVDVPPLVLLASFSEHIMMGMNGGNRQINILKVMGSNPFGQSIYFTHDLIVRDFEINCPTFKKKN